MTAPIVVAIDPGAKHTGVVARHGGQLLADRICERRDGETIDFYAQRCSQAAIDVAVDAKGDLVPVDVLAVEAYNPPTPQMGSVALESVVDTAYLVGHLHADVADLAVRAVLIPPGRHGRAPLGAYPETLVTDREKRGTSWRLRPAGRSSPASHCRSAWDIAGAAAQQHRTRARRRTRE